MRRFTREKHSAEALSQFRLVEWTEQMQNSSKGGKIADRER
jgi:hypothetical protein